MMMVGVLMLLIMMMKMIVVAMMMIILLWWDGDDGNDADGDDNNDDGTDDKIGFVEKQINKKSTLPMKKILDFFTISKAEYFNRGWGLGVIESLT